MYHGLPTLPEHFTDAHKGPRSLHAGLLPFTRQRENAHGALAGVVVGIVSSGSSSASVVRAGTESGRRGGVGPMANTTVVSSPLPSYEAQRPTQVGSASRTHSHPRSATRS